MSPVTFLPHTSPADSLALHFLAGPVGLCSQSPCGWAHGNAGELCVLASLWEHGWVRLDYSQMEQGKRLPTEDVV